jgi:hypothetical protein
MRSLRLLLLLALPSLFNVACGSVTMTGGTGGQNGSGGSTGGNHGTGGGTGGESCAQLQDAYAAAFPQARACSPNSGGGQCDQQVPSTLGCGCQTFVNDKSTLDQIQARWTAANCQAVCPAIACLAPKTGACRAGDAGGGTCADVLGP